MSKLSHLDEEGRAAMVDVSAKADTERMASAEGFVRLSAEAYALAVAGNAPKGDVFGPARIAGILAAKKTSDLIPLCHPLALSHVGIDFETDADAHAIRIIATAKTTGPTGVEMEALTAASVAALTLYDMIKAVDRTAIIDGLRIMEKSGGKSGTYKAPSPPKRAAKPSAGPAPHSAKALRAVSPRVLVHEVGGTRIDAAPSDEREALRAFMTERKLRPVDWAKSAGVPLNEIYAFLNGRARTLTKDSAEKLAQAARASVDDMLGRKGR
jgi:cyclic pyranopterin phosphate synthase